MRKNQGGRFLGGKDEMVSKLTVQLFWKDIPSPFRTQLGLCVGIFWSDFKSGVWTQLDWALPVFEVDVRPVTGARLESATGATKIDTTGTKWQKFLKRTSCTLVKWRSICIRSRFGRECVLTTKSETLEEICDNSRRGLTNITEVEFTFVSEQV